MIVGHADPDQIDAESVYGENEAENIANANKRQRTKNKHLVSRRTLRQRKIHSLKRQIQIKEKMLEVKSNYTITVILRTINISKTFKSMNKRVVF